MHQNQTAKPELIRYFRHPNEGWLYGVLVMTGPSNIGWSACSRRDQFCRHIGREIARSRAATGVYRLPKLYNGLDKNRNRMIVPIRGIIEQYQLDANAVWRQFTHRNHSNRG